MSRAAAHGTSGTAGSLPHLDRIQRLFGRHDVTGVQAHVGGAAAQGAAAMGAEAFATGNRVAFRAQPDLHTAAHEAAHVVQQRAGVQLKGGVGEVGDAYERHADGVADLVVCGESAEALLDTMAGPHAAGGGAAIQRMIIPIGDLVDRGGLDEVENAQVIKSSTERLQPHDGRVEHLDPTGVQKPLSGLGKTEELQIVAHGGSPLLSEVADTYGGHSPDELARLLVSNGLKPSYAGVIYLNGCNTATKSVHKTSYAERLQAALFKTYKRSITVRGNEGGSRVLSDGQTGFKKTDLESQTTFKEIQHAQSKLKGLYNDLINVQYFTMYPGKLAQEDGGLEALGLDETANTETILNALKLKCQEKARVMKETSNKVNLDLHSDALFEPRPDLVKTFPRPATDNELLVKLSLLMVAVSALASQVGSPLNIIVMVLGVVVGIALMAREISRRPT